MVCHIAKPNRRDRLFAIRGITMALKSNPNNQKRRLGDGLSLHNSDNFDKTEIMLQRFWVPQ